MSDVRAWLNAFEEALAPKTLKATRRAASMACRRKRARSDSRPIHPTGRGHVARP
jgi:hypothetical protein